MTVSENRPPIDPGSRRLTVADLAVLPSELPSGPVLFELDNGRLVAFPVHDFRRGAVESHIATSLLPVAKRADLGEVLCGGTGIVLWRDPDRVIGADVAFISKVSLPAKETPEEYLETIPELVVEVIGMRDTAQYTARKVDDCLLAGVRVVWVADPDARTLTAYRRNAEPRVYVETETVSLPDLIPGLQLSLNEVFDYS